MSQDSPVSSATSHQAAALAKGTLDALQHKDPKAIVMRDRSTPLWANVLSASYAAGTSLCLLTLAALTFYVQDLVVAQGFEILAPILTVVGLVPVLGMLLFAWGHARSLKGYRYIREVSAGLGQTVIAALVLTATGFVHPLFLGAPIVALVIGGTVAGPLQRWMPREQAWDFDASEAVAFFSGRDKRALDLSRSSSESAALVPPVLFALQVFTGLATFALASWLALRELLNPAAATAVALMTFWAVRVIHEALLNRSRLAPENAEGAGSVVLHDVCEDAEQADTGLWVQGLTVQTPAGDTLLNDVSFHCQPGQIIGLVGDGLSGKSLLLRALNAPHDLTALQVEGCVQVNGIAPWPRVARQQRLLTHHLPPVPLLTNASGEDNLTCFSPDRRSRAEKLLKALVFNSDTVSHIVAAPDPRHLSQAHQNALAFARALLLQPDVFLIDRPEDGTNETLRNAFLARLQQQARAGACIVLASEDRRFQECCDQLLVLQKGRVVEFGPSAEIRGRHSSGWQRFVADLSLDSEEALDSWLRAQFRRDGDEGNRRKVCLIANELLALACRRTGVSSPDAKLQIDFKLMAGRCLLKLHVPKGHISSATLDLAKMEAEELTTQADLTPLARVLREAASVENIMEEDRGHLLVTIAIYDPRLATPASGTTGSDVTRR